MPSRYNKYGVRYGKTHCPRPGTMVEVEPTKKGNLPNRALVIRKARAGYVDVQFRFNAGPGHYEVACDRLSKALTKRGSKFLPRPLNGGKRRRKRRR